MSDHSFWHGDRSRRIVERFVVQLDLHLVTPAHLGNGDEEDLTDMPLLTDLLDPTRPILLGTSLGGALRAALRRWELGHFVASKPSGKGQSRIKSHLLLGDPVTSQTSNAEDQLQSPLIVDDAVASSAGSTEIRDGVRLNPKSRTADEQGLYNAEFWQAGTVFSVRVELAISEMDDAAELKMAFAMALACLHEAKVHNTVTLGARKRRGFGVVEAKDWRFRKFDLRTIEGIESWLCNSATETSCFKDIQSALVGGEKLPDRQGREFTVSGTFAIDGSLLIRSGSVQDDLDIDMVHLHSHRNGQEIPIISGTTLAGALRTRCWAIAEVISGCCEFAESFVGGMFGPMLHDRSRKNEPHASRVSIREADISGATSGDDRLIQSRVGLDRFTSGPLETALFDEQPVFGPKINGQDVCATLSFAIAAPTDAQIGLFLLAVKDLATGDLAVGGEISVGRGMLKLISALTIRDRNGGDEHQLMLGPNGETQNTGHRERLNGYVAAMHAAARSARTASHDKAGVLS